MRLMVRARPGHPTQGILSFGQLRIPCALGRGGIRSIKREGDGATPLGTMRLLYGYRREGHLFARATKLDLKPVGAKDGWCDAVGDRNYNRPVKLPYGRSHETLTRKDRLYDCVIVLDYNIRPRRRGMGSAIFFHIARPGYTPTEGCVAISPRDMARLLPHLSTRNVMEVRR